MSLRRITLPGRAAAIVITLLMACSAFAGSSATLLLEEPYGAMGFFTATGHAAVYLSGVCAETPVVLRPCAPGETGIVISRYDGVGKHDWVAIPLIPYLYAVERPEDIPLFADAKMTSFLRDRYRRTHLEAIAPDVRNGETPGGNWYQLIGSSYDRAIYGFEIETTAGAGSRAHPQAEFVAKHLSLPPGFAQLRRFRERHHQLLLPQIAAPQRLR